MTEIYAIVHPETGDYVYIGRTSQGKRPRLHQHKYCGSDLSEWIQSLDKNPDIKILAEVEDDISDLVERKMITKYSGQVLFNKTYNASNDVEFISEVETFLNERPSISFSGICREAGITPQYLRMILNGERNMTKQTKKKVLPIIKKYGY